MSGAARVLVVANRTADSDELLDALRERATRGPVEITLLVPQTWEVRDPHGGRESATRRMRAALERLRDEGLAAEGQLGDPDPGVAVEAIWDPARFDEVIVSTLPHPVSKWLALDLPHRVARLTGAPVTHVVASEREPVS